MNCHFPSFLVPLGAWEGHICSSFLVFRGTPLELSQSHVSCATCPEDPEPLAAYDYFGLVLSLDFAGFFNGLFAGNLNIHRALMLILLTAWIGPSLLFMEWAFLWNFGPQHSVIYEHHRVTSNCHWENLLWTWHAQHNTCKIHNPTMGINHENKQIRHQINNSNRTHIIKLNTRHLKWNFLKICLSVFHDWKFHLRESCKDFCGTLATGASTREQVANLSCEKPKNLDFETILSISCL